MSIELHKVSKKFDQVSVLDNINLLIDSHEFFVLVGPSGSGKTTTLKMMNRLIDPTEGEIRIDGEDISKMNLRELRLRIGFVLQQIALFPNMTVAENIGLIPSMKGWDRTRIQERVRELLPMVGLQAAKYMNRKPAQLSGGEAQRIGILRALASDPNIILMDEPFSALDPVSRKQLQNLVKKLHRDFHTTIVFVTHDMNEAMTLADKIAVFGQGKIQQVGLPEEIQNDPANDFVASFFEDFQKDLSAYTLADLTGSTAKMPGETPLTEAIKHLENGKRREVNGLA